MGLNLETLVTILVVLTLVILADAVRRMIRDRRSQFKLNDLSKHGLGEDGEEAFDNPELPNGGARVVTRKLNKQAEQEASQADLFEPNGLASEHEEINFHAAEVQPAPQQEEAEAAVESATPAEKPAEQVAEDAAAAQAPEPTPEPQPEPARPRAPKIKLPEGEAPEVLVARVVPPKGYSFVGPGLLQLIKDHGLEFGDMNIFHAYGEKTEANVQQFSMANAVEPGTFDIEHFDETEVFGFTFFLMLPGPARPLAALNRMLDVVTSLGKALGAELEDEHRSVLTPQTMEHMRERVREFERRSRLK